jgi:hypothetical protein
MANEICTWDREVRQRLMGEALYGLVSKPKFVCKKCFRVANDKSLLCKSVKLKALKPKD